MADLQFTARTPEVALVAATAKTVIKATLPANHRGKLLEWGVYFDGTSAVSEPCVVELIRPTSSGTFSATGTVKVDTHTETVQTVVEYNATVEPTFTDVIETKEVHPQSGYEKTYGLGQEVKIGGSGRIGIRITSPSNVNVVPYLKIEE